MERKEHWKGKRKLGAFIFQDNGIVLYVALKGHAEIDKAKAASISDALRSGKAGWSLDMATLMAARSHGVKYVVIKLRKKRHLWIARFDKYMDPTKARLVTKGKRMSRILPIGEFVHAMDEIKL